MVRLIDSTATEQFGAKLFHTLSDHRVIFLRGDLGAGKTTFVRGFLRAAGHQGSVKSPTYNLVEEYVISGKKIYHFDLYRLDDPEELEYIGLVDYFNSDCIGFVEWPDKGHGFLPKPDLEIDFFVTGTMRNAEIRK